MQLRGEVLLASRVALGLRWERRESGEVWNSVAEEFWLERQHRLNPKSMDAHVLQSDKERPAAEVNN